VRLNAPRLARERIFQDIPVAVAREGRDNGRNYRFVNTDAAASRSVRGTRTARRDFRGDFREEPTRKVLCFRHSGFFTIKRKRTVYAAPLRSQNALNSTSKIERAARPSERIFSVINNLESGEEPGAEAVLSVAGNFVDRIFTCSHNRSQTYRKQPAVAITLANALRGYRTRAREMIHEFLLSAFPLPRRAYGRDRQFALS